MSANSRTARITSREVWIVLANTVVLLMLLALIWRLRTLVSWTLVALLLALAAEPIVEWLMQHRLRRGVAVLVVFAVAIGLLATLLGTLLPMLVAQGRDLIARGPELLDRIEELDPVQWLDTRVGVIDRTQEAVRGLAGGSAVAVAGTVLHGVVGLVTTLILAVFMQLFGPEIVRKSLSSVAPAKRAHCESLVDQMKKVVGGYVVGSLLVASIGGLVMGVTTLILGVPYFIPLALVMIVLGLVPFVGSALGAVLVVGVTYTTAGTKAGIVALVVYLVYQQIENHILHPLVQRHTIHMNPLLIALTLLAGGMLAGILGVALALPVAGAIQVLLQDALARRETQPLQQ